MPILFENRRVENSFMGIENLGNYAPGRQATIFSRVFIDYLLVCGSLARTRQEQKVLNVWTLR
jgi:hypothetical protein